MSWEIGLVFGSLLLLIPTLYFHWIRPVFAFLLVVFVFILFGILTPAETLKGFANEQLANIVLLLIIGNVLGQSEWFKKLISKVLHKGLSNNGVILRMLAFIGIPSGILNNTPLVAMAMPFVYNWSKENKRSTSQFLIPLSYISILGGCLTLVGTSTHMMVNSLLAEYDANLLLMFDFTLIGAIMFVLGGAYIFFTYKKWLPNRKNVSENLLESQREFLLETHIENRSGLNGKTIEEAGLRNLHEAYLIEVIRDQERMFPVAPDYRLKDGDVLIFVCSPTAFQSLRSVKGLALPKKGVLSSEDSSRLREVVVSQNSRLAGKLVKDSNFRAKYDGVIIGVHRNGERLGGRLGQIELEPGDVLLILAGPDFRSRVSSNPHFYSLSTYENEGSVPSWKIVFILMGLVASIVLSSLGLVSLFTCLLLIILSIVLFKVKDGNQLRNAIDFNLIVFIGCGLAVGKALHNSGSDVFITDHFTGTLLGMHPLLFCMSLFFVSNILAAFLNTKTSIALLIPIALEISQVLNRSGDDLYTKPIVLLVAFGAAANFITPIGYQTNLMVMGAGNYRFKDYLTYGMPLSILYLVVCSCLIYWLYF